MKRTILVRPLIALFVAGLTVSCSKLEPIEPKPAAGSQTVANQNYSAEVIPLELAKQVAENEAFQNLYLPLDSTKAAAGGRIAARTVKQALTLKDQHQQPALHLLSYESGGFAILSAERAYDPVLAVGDETLTNVDQVPDAVKEWLGQQQKGIERIRLTKRSSRMSSTSHGPTWTSLLASTGMSKLAPNARMCDTCPEDSEPPTDCHSTGTTFMYPLVKCNWDQNGGGALSYNYYTPGGALAGCGPVAAAQIMYYYKYPSSFISRHPSWFPNQWTTMSWASTYPDQSSYYTAHLLACIGYSAQSSWGVSATGTNIDNLAAALKGDFGYKTSYVKIGPTMWDILQQLALYRPVLMRGTQYSGGSGGHLWVCDGYMKTTSTCYPPFYWLHMNWGWGGAWNGYYSDSYSSSTTGTYYYDETGHSAYKPDQNPNHSNNSDVFYWNRKMIVLNPN